MTKILPSLCLVVLLAAPIGAEKAAGPLRSPTLVKRVVDGDTLLLSDDRRVRLIGIDTPEWHASAKLRKDAERNRRDAKTIQALGARSARFAKELMEGREVHLVSDKSNKAGGDKDKYGRSLAYVYFDPPPCDELEPWLSETVCELDSYEKGFLNALMIEAGYANVYAKFPFKHREEFQRLQREAREEKRGLWKESGPLTQKRPGQTGPAGQKT